MPKVAKERRIRRRARLVRKREIDAALAKLTPVTQRIFRNLLLEYQGTDLARFLRITLVGGDGALLKILEKR